MLDAPLGLDLVQVVVAPVGVDLLREEETSFIWRATAGAVRVDGFVLTWRPHVVMTTGQIKSWQASRVVLLAVNEPLKAKDRRLGGHVVRTCQCRHAESAAAGSGCDGYRRPAYLSDGFLLFAPGPVEIFVGIAQTDARGHDTEAAPVDCRRRR